MELGRQARRRRRRARLGRRGAMVGLRRHRVWRRKRWLGYLVLRTCLLVPGALATEPPRLATDPVRPATEPAREVGREHRKMQDLAVDEVYIEGKLYSPQALFVVARPQESFGRDAVVPHYLQLEPGARFLQYRLAAQPEGTPAAAETTAAVEGPVLPRRSP